MDSLERRGDPSAVPVGRGRDSLFLTAQLRPIGASDSLTVRVRNLSPGGLMAEVIDLLDPEAPVEVEVRGIGWIPGRIAWHTEGRMGIAFDRPIDPQRARKPIGAAVAKRSGPFARP